MAVIDRAADSPAVSAGVERAIRQGPEWFSRLEPFWTTVVVGQSIRCDLYSFDLSDDRSDGVAPTTCTTDRAEVLPLYACFTDYLAGRGGGTFALERLGVAAELAERHPPTETTAGEPFRRRWFAGYHRRDAVRLFRAGGVPGRSL